MTDFDTERQDEAASTEQVEDIATPEESQDDVQSVIDAEVEDAQHDPDEADVLEDPGVDETSSSDEVVEEIEDDENVSTDEELVVEAETDKIDDPPSEVDASETDIEDELAVEPVNEGTEPVEAEQVEIAEVEDEAPGIAPQPEPDDDDRAWFVVHCYSGTRIKSDTI